MGDRKLPCVIRKLVNDHFENFVALADDVWRLREQVESLEAWLRDNRHQLDATHEWIADIGFCSRKDALGGGPPITRELMEMCLEVNLEIWLSEYPGEA